MDHLFTTKQGVVKATPVQMIQYIVDGTNDFCTMKASIVKKQQQILSSIKSHILLYNTKLHTFKLVKVHTLIDHLDQFRFVNDILLSWLNGYLESIEHNSIDVEHDDDEHDDDEHDDDDVEHDDDEDDDGKAPHDKVRGKAPHDKAHRKAPHGKARGKARSSPHNKDEQPKTIVKMIKHNINVIRHFDLDTLQRYNMSGLYHNDAVHQEIVSCPRRSYIKYIKTSKPHYMRSEMVQYGLNLGVITESDAYDAMDFSHICRQVSRTEISAETIMSHHRHAIACNCHYLIKSFSFFLSADMNKPLRQYTHVSPMLSQHIKMLNDCITFAPPFPHDTFVYRFIHDDGHLKKLKVGDVHTNTGFTSASKSPFCKLDSEFGFVLIKIKIPAGRTGVGLMVETMSYFPQEEEIILPCGMQLKLVAVDKDVKYYHTVHILESAVVKRYEFEIVPKQPHLQLPPVEEPTVVSVEKLKLRKTTLRESIESFLKQSGKHVTINNVPFTCTTFDSTGMYKSLYSTTLPFGLALVSMNNNGKIEMMVEIVPDLISVNYIHRWQNNDNPKFSNDDIVSIAQTCAHMFDILKIHVYCDQRSQWFLANQGSSDVNHLQIEQLAQMTHTINYDFYIFVKTKQKRFSNSFASLYYGILNEMKEYALDSTQVSKVSILRNMLNIANKSDLEELFLFICESQPAMMDDLIQGLSIILNSDENPFLNEKYVITY